MTFAPASILDARALIRQVLPEIPVVGLGVVGDDNHAKTGSSYHLGKSALRPDSYTIVESPRDRSGLSEAASALDFGWWQRTVRGKTHNLRTFSVWLVAQCKAGAPDTLDIREVIYSPDGKTVRRWDRLGKRTTGDASHREHTHTSWFRDSEHRDKTAVFRRYFTEIGLLEDDDMTPDEMVKTVRNTKEFLSDTNVDIIAKAAAAKLTPVLNQLLAMAKGEQAEKPPTVDEIKAAVRDAVGDLPSPQEKAALLLPLLGADAVEVGRILAGA